MSSSMQIKDRLQLVRQMRIEMDYMFEQYKITKDISYRNKKII